MKHSEAGSFVTRACVLALTCTLAGLMTIGLLVCLGSRLPRAAWAVGGDPPTSAPSALRRLTYDGRSTPLAWTQDGRTLLVKRPGRVVGKQQLSELWALAVSEGREWQVSENAFSPSVHEDQVAYLRFVEPGRWEAVTSDLSGERSSTLGMARWNLPPAWIGGDVRYLDHRGGWAPSRRAETPLPPELSPLHYTRAALSSDGRWAAVTDGRTLWAVGAGGQIAVRQAVQILGFSWSPTGAQLAYTFAGDGPAPELWVWDQSTGQAQMLVRGALEHLGVPAWSPDGGVLAFSRHPTGNGSNAAGDLWLVRADGTDLHPLAQTPADEASPCWSPDGAALALSIGGDVWIADLQSPDLGAALHAAGDDLALDPSLSDEMLAGGQAVSPCLTAPLTIRVKHDAAGNLCRNVPDGQIDHYPFEWYVRRVVPQEVYPSWPAEALRAQAVAARTYAWYQVLKNRDQEYDVWDSTRSQYLCDRTYASTDAAVEHTQGQYVAYDGGVIHAFFSAELGDPTNPELKYPTVPYLRPVRDPVSFGEPRWGHGMGMSQWGAYRWTAWHAWDYQQVLCHYYTSAEVRRSCDITRPLAGLTLPWPDFYVNTGQAALRANAADDTGVLTVTFGAQVTDTWTVLYTDTAGSDGWGAVWPVHGVSETLTPSIGLRVTAYDGMGHATKSEVSWVGLDRTPPTGTLSISSTEVATLGVRLYATATDPAPASAAIRVSLGRDDWVWEDGDLYTFGGEIVTDSAASDGSAWHIGPGDTGVLYGPYTRILPAGQAYRATFRLKAPATVLTDPLELAKLDVAVDSGATLLGVRYLRGTEFRAGDAYQEFAVDFWYPEGGGRVEFRVDSGGTADLWADQVTISGYPVGVPAWISWTLPAREGVVTVTARFVDGAENVSPGATLAVSVTDNSPPGEWRGFGCHGLTCTVQVRDAIAGLDVGSATYRHSADGGTTWSGWLPATCSGANGSHDWETISAADVPLVYAAGDAIQFSVYDSAVLSNEGSSPVYRIQRVYLPLVMR